MRARFPLRYKDRTVTARDEGEMAGSKAATRSNMACEFTLQRSTASAHAKALSEIIISLTTLFLNLLPKLCKHLTKP